MRSRYWAVVFSATLIAGAIVYTAGASTQVAAARKAPVVLPVSVISTYIETNQGTNQSDGSIKGILGHGTFALSTSAKSVPVLKLPAAKKTSRKRSRTKPKRQIVALSSVLTGGTYVTRLDVGSDGNYGGTLVLRFSNTKLGSICLTGSLVLGTYTPGSPFPPSTVTLTSVGGTALAASLRLGLTAQLTAASGLDTMQFTDTGSLTASASTPKSPTADCTAVDRLSP